MSIEFIIKLFEAPKGMGLEGWKTASEIFKNVLEALAVLGGIGAVVAWLYQRKDRATDILLKLEEKFDQPIIKHGRACLEENNKHEELEPWLAYYVVKAEDRTVVEPPVRLRESGRARKPTWIGDWIGALLGIERAGPPKASSGESPAAEGPFSDIEAVDALLRFYVVLCGVRAARQVPDASLLACYRYWLAFYYVEDREKFRAYVDRFYPTLRTWLAEYRTDTKEHAFFHPQNFWTKDRLISKLERK